MVDDPALQELLRDFSIIFEEPMVPPPSRGDFYHQIPLESGANPVNLRPYRYSALQKDVIDKMIRDMLSQGIIQCSSSPYASPVVLVKKKDGTWRLCLDFHGLNKQTIKDKYPIPLLRTCLMSLEALSTFPSWIFEQDSTSFACHLMTSTRQRSRHTQVLTKNLVMPFGLTNAPCMFQSLMDRIFEGVLRKFLLIFFDDILIYNSCWEDHLQHLREVFQILQREQLYLKPSKCTFGATVIEYLRHFISGEGVSTDPSKIKTIVQWPIPTKHKQLISFLGLASYYR